MIDFNQGVLKVHRPAFGIVVIGVRRCRQPSAILDPRQGSEMADKLSPGRFL
jgi:hypothetical protein